MVVTILKMFFFSNLGANLRQFFLSLRSVNCEMLYVDCGVSSAPFIDWTQRAGG